MKTLDAAQRSREFFHGLFVPTGTWAIVRVDGRSFSKLTEAHFAKPFDAAFAEHMHAVAVALLDGFGSVFGYTESDEISIVLPPDFSLFNRSVEKLVSLTAATAAAEFSIRLGTPAAFDSRIWVGSSSDDVVDYLAWRQADATRAALNGAAYWTLRNDGISASRATSRLSRMSRADKHELLHGYGVNFNDLPVWAKRGVAATWETYDHVGVDPRTDTEVPTTRRRIVVHQDIAHGDEYRNWAADKLRAA